MEKNIFISRTNLAGEGASLFLNDFEALGQHLHDLDNRWSYTVSPVRFGNYTYGVYMRLVYDNKFSITSYIDKGNSSSDLWQIERIPSGRTQLFFRLADPSLLPSRLGKYTLITLLPTPSAYPAQYQNYSSTLWFKSPRVQGSGTSYLNYGIGLSNYGAMMTIPIVSSLTEVSASSVDCYFFEMQNVIDPEKKTWGMLVNMAEGPTAETKNDFPTEMFLLSGEHLQLEKLPSEYFTSMKNRGVVPVLTNMCSKQIKYYAPHLYIKETAHDDCFGHIKIEDKYFLAGAGFALETDEHN